MAELEGSAGAPIDPPPYGVAISQTIPYDMDTLTAMEGTRSSLGKCTCVRGICVVFFMGMFFCASAGLLGTIIGIAKPTGAYRRCGINPTGPLSACLASTEGANSTNTIYPFPLDLNCNAYLRSGLAFNDANDHNQMAPWTDNFPGWTRAAVSSPTQPWKEKAPSAKGAALLSECLAFSKEHLAAGCPVSKDNITTDDLAVFFFVPKCDDPATMTRRDGTPKGCWPHPGWALPNRCRANGVRSRTNWLILVIATPLAFLVVCSGMLTVACYRGVSCTSMCCNCWRRCCSGKEGREARLREKEALLVNSSANTGGGGGKSGGSI